jgi:hypothetical protein
MAEKNYIELSPRNPAQALPRKIDEVELLHGCQLASIGTHAIHAEISAQREPLDGLRGGRIAAPDIQEAK